MWALSMHGIEDTGPLHNTTAAAGEWRTGHGNILGTF